MKKGVHGEGNYEATRDYDKRTKEYLESADVTEDARKAAPRSEEEAREMAQAEAAGKRHAKGGVPDDSPKASDSDDG